MEELYALMQSCWKIEPSDRIETSILDNSVKDLKNYEQEGIIYERADDG